MTRSNAVRQMRAVPLIVAQGFLVVACSEPTKPSEGTNPPAPNPAEPVPPGRVTGWHAYVYTPGVGVEAIPDLPGTIESIATGINDNGEVVGHMRASGSVRAFIWSKARGTVDLGSLPGGSGPFAGAFAASINEKGEVAGSSLTTGNSYHAFKWSRTGGMIDLGVPPGALHSFANGISDKGEIVGQSWTRETVDAFRWSAETGMRSAGPVPPGVSTQAIAINDAGLILGSVLPDGDPYSDPVAGFVWSPEGERVELVSCGFTAECTALGAAVNAAGVVAGSDKDGAFKWSRAGGLVRLAGTSVLHRSSGAGGINDKGDIVGSISVDYKFQAVVWRGADEPELLPLLPGKKWSYATGINNGGQVVGATM